jgi:hypothetical protein
MANANDIDSYHHHLAVALNGEGLLGQAAAIRPDPKRNWKNPKFTGPVDFDLWPTEAPMTAKSDQGGELAVFAFEKLTKIGSGELVEIEDEGDGSICWISWHERWERLVPERVFPGKKSKQPHFMLGTIQWILFWGRPEDEKVQIIRSEWDNAAHVTRKKKEYEIAKSKDAKPADEEDEDSLAGQPHWHVDRVVELGDVDAFLEHRGTELRELAHSSYAGQYLNLQRVHLAMGGWKNEATGGAAVAANHAARWQIEYTEDRDELIEWNISTLRYIKSQIHYIGGY